MTYCSSIYGSQIWNFERTNLIEKMYVAYRKCLRRLLDISYKTHNYFLHHIVGDLPLDVKLHKRVATFVNNCLTGNALSKLCIKIAANGSSSSVCNSLNVLRQTYGFNLLNGSNSACKIYPNKVQARTEMQCCIIKDFLVYRDNNTDDYENLTYIINFLCEE